MTDSNNNSIQDLLLRALALQQEGDLGEAEKHFRQALRQEPRSVPALYSLAAIEHTRKNYPVALRLIDRALKIFPNFTAALDAKAVILRSLGRLEESQSLHLRARTLEQGGGAHGDVETPARRATDGANKLTIDHPKQSLGLKLQEAGDREGARQVFLALIDERPDDFVALYSLAVIAAQLGSPSEGLAWIDRVLKNNPNHAQSQFARGTLLQQMGLFDDALAAFDRANLIDPTYLDAWNNKASLFQTLSREYDAYDCLLQALKHHPRDEKLLHNTGTILTVLKRDTEAIAYFDKLLAVNPKYEYAPGYRFFAKLHTCQWDNYEEERQAIIEAVKRGEPAINPLAFFSLSEDPAEQLKCSQIFAQTKYPVAKGPLWRGEAYKHRKIRLAYLSPDFREHPVGHLMVGVIEQHDRIRFETFGFSLGINDGSRLRTRFRLGFDHFFDCKERTSLEIAQLIRACEVDILVDLAGYTSSARPEIFAMRPAPVQVNYLGFPGTSGAAWMDFIIADNVVIPPGEERHYQESVLRLPCCYLPIDDQVQASKDTPTRESMGLPSRGRVYCSFNHDYKINPPIWDLWMDLLREDPQSTLWLMKLNDAAEANLRKEANRRDIDPSRLVFATRVPRVEDHLARYRLIDVFLDTAPYNAHSTVTDVIRAGGTVVTMPGRTFASRVAASYIEHNGATDSAITNNKAEYLEKARRGKKDLPDLQERMSERYGPGLSSAASMATNLEEIYEGVYR